MPPRRRRRAGLAVFAGALAAGLLAGVGYAVGVNHDSSTSGQATTLPATNRAPVTTPSTSPNTSNTPTQSPSTTPTTSDGGVGTTSLSGLDVGVVDIDTQLKYQQASAAGTGIILDTAGDVLTNNHVIDGATSIKVTDVTTGKSYTATVIGTDPSADVAVLKLQGASGLRPAKIGDSSKLAVGDAVTAVGNAGGVGGTPTATSGNVTALDQEITASDAGGGNAEQLTGLIQVNASLQPGDSGGPLYNSAGQVVGIDTAGSGNRRFRTNGGAGFAIPIQTAVNVAQQIEAGKADASITIGVPGFLGVAVQSSSDTSTSNSNVSGAVITQVVSGTPAASSGLQVGDVITSVDGKTVDSADALSAALHGHHGGDKVTVKWTDTSGASRSASVTLAVGPAN